MGDPFLQEPVCLALSKSVGNFECAQRIHNFVCSPKLCKGPPRRVPSCLPSHHVRQYPYPVKAYCVATAVCMFGQCFSTPALRDGMFGEKNPSEKSGKISPAFYQYVVNKGVLELKPP